MGSARRRACRRPIVHGVIESMAQEQSKAPVTGKKSSEPGEVSGTAKDLAFEVGAADKQTKKLSERLADNMPAPKPVTQPGGSKTADTAADEISRRGAEPARSRIAANDDLPSIGGLIYALQQRPTRAPFYVAFAASVVWVFVCLGAALFLFNERLSSLSTGGEMLRDPATLTLGATLIVPITLFWFLALLIWRAQELRLMASAMTEVAVRLAEPDKMATQSVASLGQSIRRQVAAMNDGISRALGRAGELEALVHNEVAALERSYSENESRIRGLIGELAGEREALANNSDRVRETLSGVGAQVTKDIANAGELATRSLTSTTTKIAQQLTSQGDLVTKKLDAAGTRVSTALQGATQKAAQVLDVKSSTLMTSLTAVGDQLVKDIPGLLDRLDGEQKRLNSIISSATQNFSALETAIATRTTQLDGTLKTRTEELKSVLADRIKALDATVQQQAKSIESSLSTSTMKISQVFAEGSDTLKKTTEHMTRQSSQANANLTAQADSLKGVSHKLLNQVHGLVQRFDAQGQAITSASQALDSSNAQIDSILQRRHSEITSLLETVSAKAQGLDKMMRSYSGIIEGSLTQVEERAKQITGSLAQETTAQASHAIAEIERLRSNARSHTEQAVAELTGGFQSITSQVADQLGTLSSRFDSTTREMRQTVSSTADEIEGTRQELQRRMRVIPQAAQHNQEAVRKAVSDQLKALGALSALSTGNSAGGLQQPAPGYSPQPGTAYPGQTLPPPAGGFGAPATTGNNPVSSGDMAAVTSSLTGRLDAAANMPAQTPSQPAPQTTQLPASGLGVNMRNTPASAQGDTWSVGDLLARASEPDHSARTAAPPPPPPPQQPAIPAYDAPAAPGGELRLNDIAAAIDQTTASNIWQRFRQGEHNVFDRQIYTPNGQATFDEISGRYQRDPAFRTTVQRYIADFERLLSDAERKGQNSEMIHNYLTSETGRVYLMLAHASRRLR